MCRTFGLPEPVREHKFAKEAMGRLWRLDFCWPDIPVKGAPDFRFAVEVEGVVWYQNRRHGHQTKSRHQTAKGFIEDAAKYEAALNLGWIVYRVPHVWIAKDKKIIWRPECVQTIKRRIGM